MNKERIEKFKKLLAEGHVFVADGAMGTRLYNKGVFINRCFDELNISRPELVKEIHSEYIAVGAEIITTNTFTANRFKLAPHGFVRKLEDINRAGADIAREAAGDGLWVAGSVGPLAKPPLAVVQKKPEEAYDAFCQQIRALDNGSIDLILLETMYDLDEITLAIKAAREVSDLPVIASITFTDNNKTVFGDSPRDAMKAMQEAGADIAGLNCSSGPRTALQCATEMMSVASIPMIVQPNAGSPQIVEGRFIYMSTPEYVATYAQRFVQSVGAQIVGGCCGTTPEHIKEVRSFVRAVKPARRVFDRPVTQVVEAEAEPALEPIKTLEKSAFARKLKRKFTTSVELYPPKGMDPKRILASAELLKEYGVDCVNIPDGPRAMARMSPMALAHLIESEIGIETILHYCCRDRNILGMQSDILGCNALGLRNILAITGDPPKLGDYPDATSVFDIDAIGLVQMLAKLNRGQDLVGSRINSQSSFHIGVGANPGAINIENEIERFEAKVNAGAEFVMTQPIFEVKQLESFIAATADYRIPMMVGVLPLVSLRNAEFLHNEVPGVEVPKAIRDRLEKCSDDKAARQVGIEIAREAIAASKELDGVAGVYVMPPFGRVKMALSVLDLD
jgi:methionine synthase I (cobalamin-dependent)/5,10-methylenetetrahydrofolate reductase